MHSALLFVTFVLIARWIRTEDPLAVQLRRVPVNWGEYLKTSLFHLYLFLMLYDFSAGFGPMDKYRVIWLIMFVPVYLIERVWSLIKFKYAQ